jgi:response regulator RpfG family c-di-GMP phosphodiesterase
VTTSDRGSTPPRPRARVLVVDDEPGNLFTFRRVFASQYDITLASSGREALMRLDAATGDQAFDVVLLDFAMPEMNGAHFLAALREKHPTIACLFLTAYAELEEVKKVSGRYRVAAVIMKPWEKDDVERRIEHALRLSKMKRTTSTMRS